MNTSKQAEKIKAEKEKKELAPETDLLNTEELTEEEKEQMENSGPGKMEVANLQELNLQETFANMDKVKTADAKEVTANYIEFDSFEEGEERNYIFTGFDQFVDDKGEVRPAVRLMDRTGKTWICASVVTVKALQKVEKVPQPVRLKVNGKVKGKNGSYYDVNVYVL